MALEIDRRTLIRNVAVAAPVALLPMSARAQRRPDPTTVYGMIEIGAKGVKASSYQLAQETVSDAGGSPAGFQRYAPKKYGKSFQVNTNVLGNRPNDADIDDTVTVVGKAIAQFQSDGIQAKNIVVVASSGVGGFAPDADPEKMVVGRLARKIKAQTGYTLEQVNPKQEAELSFKWIVLPHRRSQVLLVDVGSGNTKGGYLEAANTPHSIFHDFSIPFGSATLATEVKGQFSSDPVVNHADAFFAERIAPKLTPQINSAPGLVSRPRVYLVGGAVWATANLVQPMVMAGHSDWMPFSMTYFETLKTRVIETKDPRKKLADVALPASLSEARRQAIQAQIADVIDKFTADQLAAGIAIMQGLDRKLNFAHRDALFFASFAVDAWSSQLLVERFAEA